MIAQQLLEPDISFVTVCAILGGVRWHALKRTNRAKPFGHGNAG